MLIKVSVIIPVFNAAPFLAACVRSLLQQTLQEVEFIFVNDGSTDESGSILRTFAQSDQRIIVIESENEGVSAARNKGMRRASGEFIAFADADDLMEDTMLAYMYEANVSTGADLAICDVTILEDQAKKTSRLNLVNKQIDFSKNRDAEIENLLLFRYDFANWNKLYSTALIRKHGLQFATSMRVYEDLLFNLCFFQYAQAGVTLAKSCYNYRKHAASVMSSGALNRAVELQLLWKNYHQFCNSNGLTTGLEPFRKQMRRSNYYVTIPAITVELSKSNRKFFEQVQYLSLQLKHLDAAFYDYTSNEVNTVKDWKKRLLKGRFFKCFSLITIAAAWLKK